jgi:hypothetical protein
LRIGVFHKIIFAEFVSGKLSGARYNIKYRTTVIAYPKTYDEKSILLSTSQPILSIDVPAAI